MAGPERVRIICFDADGAVLLLKWHDTVSGRDFWEPPGGGIESGESPRLAAERELLEETGYVVRLSSAPVTVPRAYDWLGRRYVHEEAFFSATVEGPPSPAGFTAEELGTFVEARFVQLEHFASLDAPLEPPGLGAVVSELTEAD